MSPDGGEGSAAGSKVDSAAQSGVSPASTPLQLALLGDLRLDGPGTDLLRRRKKELALIAWVGLRQGVVRREELASAFWGETDDAHARQSLRQALASIRKALPDLLVTGEETVSLAPGAITLDAVEFERRLAAGELREAVALWKGDLLPLAEELGAEPFRIWVEAERARFRARLMGALHRLTTGVPSMGEQLRWAERWAELFPLDERAHTCLLGALEREGRGDEALERHVAFAARFRAETGRDLPAAVREAVEAVHRSPRRAGGSAPGSAAFFTPDMTGRDGELAALEAAWDDARGTRGVTVLIEGETGVGRTRLCTELARTITRAGPALVLEAPRDCEGAAGSAIRRFISPLIGARGLAASAPWALAELAAEFPELGEGRSLPARRDPADLAGAIAEVAGSVAEETRVLVLVDDAPGLCTELRPVVSRLVRKTPPNVLVVLTSEPEGLAGTECGRAFRESADGRRIKLRPLDTSQIEVMIASMVPIAAADRQRLAALLMSEADGNPLRVSDCISAFADAGVLSTDQNGLWRLSKGRGVASLPLPPSLIRTRLERLSAGGRATIEAAGRGGPRMDAEELAAATGLGAEETEAALGELVARRLLRPVRDTSLYELTSDAVRAATRPESGAGSAAGTRPRHRGRRRWAVTAVAAVAVLVVGIAARSALPASSTAEPGRVLVFPLANLTGSADQGAAGRLAAEAMVQGLGRLGAGTVAPLLGPDPGSQDSPDAVRRAALKQGAALAVIGSYQHLGDTLVLTARIVDVATGEARAIARDARSPAGRPAEAIAALRESVIGAIAARLDRRIAAAARAGSVPPTGESYREFAEGLDYLYAREGHRANAAFFDAYRRDTTFLLPLIYAAFSHDGQGRLDVVDSLVRVLEPRRSTMAPYEQAVLDFLGHGPGDLAARYATARRAAELAPGSMMAGYYFPRAAIALNRPREALDALDSVDPERDEIAGMPGYWSMLSMALHIAGEYERQIAMGRRVEARFPRDTRGLNYQVRALAALGRVDTLESILARGFLVPTAAGWDALGLSLHILAFDELRAHGHGARALPLLARAVAYYEQAPDSLQRVPRQRLEMARALLRVGRPADARRMAEGLVREDSVRGEVLIVAHSIIGVAAAATGDLAAAEAEDRWLGGAGTQYTFGVNTEARARIAATLGRREDAVRLLRQAVTEGRGFDNNKHLDFELQRLRGFPPFEEWLRPKG